jgi:hypothetical protein
LKTVVKQTPVQKRAIIRGWYNASSIVSHTTDLAPNTAANWVPPSCMTYIKALGLLQVDHDTVQHTGTAAEFNSEHCALPPQFRLLCQYIMSTNVLYHYRFLLLGKYERHEPETRSIVKCR